MGRFKYSLLRGFTITLLALFCFQVEAQRGAQALRTLEWAQFGTGQGQGYFIYTPEPNGKPEYYDFRQALEAEGVNFGSSTGSGGGVSIASFEYDPLTNDVVLYMSDGSNFTVNLGDLQDAIPNIHYTQAETHSIEVQGEQINSGNGVIIEYYIDSLPLFTSGAGSGSGTDDQNLSDFILDDQGTLSITIEDGNTVTADLSSLDVEVEPQTLGIIGSVISISDGNSITLPTDQFEANTDEQQLSFDDATDELALEAGGTVNLSKYNNSNGECAEITINTITAVSPIDLPQDQAGRSIYINGIRASEQTTLNRIQHVSINPTTNEVTFYEILDNDTVAFCRN